MSAITIVQTITWRPMAEAPKDVESILVFVPLHASNLQTCGLHLMKWTGWGGGVWESTNGWRPHPWDLDFAVWTDPRPIAASAAAVVK